jgi:hypothetical protein
VTWFETLWIVTGKFFFCLFIILIVILIPAQETGSWVRFPLIGFTCFLLISFIYFIVSRILGFIKNRSAMQEFNKGSKTTSGKVIYRWIEESNSYDDDTIYSYYIVISFIAKREEKAYKALVSEDLYRRVGHSETSVTYAVSDPRCFLINGEKYIEPFMDELSEIFRYIKSVVNRRR